MPSGDGITLIGRNKIAAWFATTVTKFSVNEGDMTDWSLGQYVRIWRNEGYEYGHIETFDPTWRESTTDTVAPRPTDEVMLVGDDGVEIYCRVKDLESG